MKHLTDTQIGFKRLALLSTRGITFNPSSIPNILSAEETNRYEISGLKFNNEGVLDIYITVDNFEESRQIRMTYDCIQNLHTITARNMRVDSTTQGISGRTEHSIRIPNLGILSAQLGEDGSKTSVVCKIKAFDSNEVKQN